MQTLGLSESTPRSDNRVKSLFWPEVANNTDVDALGSQGYWVCTVVAVFSFIVLAFTGSPITGFLIFLLFYFGGVGVRERSLYSAIVVTVVYSLDFFMGNISILRVIFAALLVANVRATWLSSRWRGDTEEAILPPRMDLTLADKFADQLPRWLWPKIRVLYYIFSGILVMLIALGLAAKLAGVHPR